MLGSTPYCCELEDALDDDGGVCMEGVTNAPGEGEDGDDRNVGPGADAGTGNDPKAEGAGVDAVWGAGVALYIDGAGVADTDG